MHNKVIADKTITEYKNETVEGLKKKQFNHNYNQHKNNKELEILLNKSNN